MTKKENSELSWRSNSRRAQGYNYDERKSSAVVFSQDNDAIGEADSTDLKFDEDEVLLEYAVAGVEELRARAAELRAEARSMELELLEKAAKERKEKDAITDEIIEMLFLPLQYQDPQKTGVKDKTNITTSSSSIASSNLKVIDARVVADRLRQGKYSRQQLITVVDRLYELHHDSNNVRSSKTVASELSSKPQRNETNKGVETQQSSSENSTAKSLYREYFQVLTQAAVLLDESIVANSMLEDDTKTTPSTFESKSTSSSSSSVSSLSARPPSRQKEDYSTPSSISQSVIFVTSGKLAKTIQTRISELRQKRQVELNQRMAAETNRVLALSSTSRTGENPVRYANSGPSNRTAGISISGGSFGETPTFIPLWIPPTHLPFVVSMDKSERLASSSSTPSANETSTTFHPYVVITNSTLEAAEVEMIKSDVLLGSRFYLTSYEFAPGAALFRGNIRTSLGKVPTTIPILETQNRTLLSRNKNGYDNNTAMVFEDIQQRLKKSGLGDKVQLFIVPDPEAPYIPRDRERRASMSVGMRRPGIETGSSTSSDNDLPNSPKPVILALPKKLSADESKIRKGWIRGIGKKLCYPLAALSTFLYSFYAFALNPNFYNALVRERDLSVLSHCIPLALSVLAIQVIHEASHYLVAKKRQIKIGTPVPVPSFNANVPFFGWITPLRSFPPNRAALLDFALSGPMTALAVSLGLVFSGIQLTSRATASEIARFPVLSVHSMKSSFLLGSILSWLLPKTMMLPLAQPIPMHPFFVAGTSGLITSALNLLPIFRLDGGRACFAAMGQKQGAIISVFTVLWIISDHFSGKGSPLLMFWTILVALFQMRVEVPCRDECTEVGAKRQWLWLSSFLLAISILMPFPKRGTGI